MKQLRLTTTAPYGMFSFKDIKPLVVPDNCGEVTEAKLKYKSAFIHGDAEELAGFDIPIFLDGDMAQLELPEKEQDILLLLPEGEYPLISTPEDGFDEAYYLTLKLKSDE